MVRALILRHLSPPAHDQQVQPRSGSDAFIESQQNIPSPYGIVLQIAHSELAGQLAGKLLPEAFGELP